MHVVALVKGRDHVCTRYRVAPFARHLEERGGSLTLETLADGPERREQLARPRPGQVVLLQRRLLPLYELLTLRRAAERLVYDVDDAVFLRDSFHPRGPYSFSRMVRFQAVAALADAVIAGNSFLADFLRRRTLARTVTLVPTCVDAGRYAAEPHGDGSRLVWIGSTSTMRALEDARPALEAVGRAVPGLRLRVICDRFPEFRHLAVERQAWSDATEAGGLSACDIGISPLPDDLWSRGKCGLKVLQYMAAGLPVVASGVGVHRELVAPEAGFLVRDAAQWVGRITDLLRDEALRRRMGRAARRHLDERFSTAAWGPAWVETIRRTWERRSQSGRVAVAVGGGACAG